MTAPLKFHVSGYAAWMPGAEAMLVSGKCAGQRPLPASLRRRVSLIGRKALEAAWALMPDNGIMPRIIMSSRYGEYARTVGLLTTLAEEDEVSPAEFSLSVHHALAGLLSIASSNRAGHTAIAAGPESFGYGLLEAAACLTEDQSPVILMHFEEPLPSIYDSVGGGPEPTVAFAVALSPSPNEGELVSLEMTPSKSPGADSLAVAFMDFLCARHDHAQAAGERITWRWQRGA